MHLQKLLQNYNQAKITKEVSAFFNQKVVLITGAAGSIGVEITKVLAKQTHCELILVDQSESGLYKLQQELWLNNFYNFHIIIGNVSDASQMNSIFKMYSFDIVYHIAAYKHVPLIQDNWYQAIKVNVLGTQIIANLSNQFKVAKFIYVSTDKAVNPTSVMGATKRIAELYIHQLNEKNTATFKIIRFGNVPYSNGSILPLFEQQLKVNNQILITDEHVTRYFISISKVCELMLFLVTEDANELFIANMGNQISVVDLAIRFIKLKGLKPFEDVAIKFMGLRPGEKLTEELVYEKEIKVSSKIPNLLVYSMNSAPLNNELLEELIKLNPTESKGKIVKLLKELIPEFMENS